MNKVGRPKAPSHMKKVAISVKLPGWLIQWMDNQPETNRALLIEDAIRKVHNIDP